MSGVLVAIDGPSGSGKSTVSKRLAHRLGLSYLDTGAMYRAVTWIALSSGVDLDDWPAVCALADSMPLVMDSDPVSPRLFVGDVEITTEIRSTRIAEKVPLVAKNLQLREWMVEEQRRLMLEARAGGKGMVAEGRDITTVVCPDADVRVLLVADQEARLRRRALEVHGTDSAQALADTKAQVVDRDASDSQVAEFMEAAPGVTVVDSSELNIEEVVEAVAALVADIDS